MRNPTLDLSIPCSDALPLSGEQGPLRSSSAKCAKFELTSRMFFQLAKNPTQEEGRKSSAHFTKEEISHRFPI